MIQIPGTLPAVIISYWDIDTVLIQKITLRQNVLSLLMNRISSKQRSHVKLLMEEILDMAREVNAGITVAIRSATSANLIEWIIM